MKSVTVTLSAQMLRDTLDVLTKAHAAAENPSAKAAYQRIIGRLKRALPLDMGIMEADKERIKAAWADARPHTKCPIY